MDSNLFQYIYRPENDDFDRLSVWEFFQGYEMKLISSLSNSQKENLENDYEEIFFSGSVRSILDMNLLV